MKKILISIVLVIVVVVAIALVFVTRSAPGLQGQVANDPALIERGQYVARAADCAACHTGIGGKVYGGGLKIASPVGAIYSTNITPDPVSGIGRYSLADFDRAVRQGIRKDGASLYPAMPYPSFARMTDEDIKALYAYFQHGVGPVDMPNKDEEIHWPLSMRWPLAVWRGLFAPPVAPVRSTASVDPQVARGEYLVAGPGHCGACHSPRGYAMQEKALDDHEKTGTFLAGGTVIDNWYVPSLRGDDAQGLGRWSEDDIVNFLKSGRTDHAAVFGGMADVVAWSTQYLTDEDLHAVAKYLKTLPPAEGNQLGYVYNDQAKTLLDSGHLEGNAGALVYQQQCAICHRNDGGGVPRMFPPLAGNPVVTSDDPVSVIHLVLQGGVLPASNFAPSNVSMPGYSNQLSDQQIADVSNFIRGAWGNKAAKTVTASDVAAARRGQGSSASGDAPNWTLMEPEPYGEGWTFSPQTHAGMDAAQ